MTDRPEPAEPREWRVDYSSPLRPLRAFLAPWSKLWSHWCRKNERRDTAGTKGIVNPTIASAAAARTEVAPMMHMVSMSIYPKRDITPLIDELKRSVAWWHFLDDTWLIVSAENSTQIYSRLLPFLLDTDSLLITEIVRESNIPAGRLTKEAWDWINGWKISLPAGGQEPKEASGE